MSHSAENSSVLSVEVEGHVATLWLDRPGALNAMGPDLFSDLPRIVHALDADEQIRAIVVAAKGRHFTAGLDLVAMGPLLVGGGAPPSGDPPAHAGSLIESIRQLQAAMSCFADIDTPTIAAVQGACIGGGVDLICACDIRFATNDARFSVRETKMAIVADLGSLQRLQHIIGAGLVNELALTGKDIDAAEANRIGLINALAPDSDGVLELAQNCAAEIAANSPLVVRGTKRILRASAAGSIDEGLELVAQWNAVHLRSRDLDEAIAAFVEKRVPKFEGR